MKILRLFQEELATVGDSVIAGAVTRSEQKAMQDIYAKAFRRALRRFRSGGERRAFH